MRGSHARERSRNLRRYVRGYVMPRDSALKCVGQRHGWIEMRPEIGPKAKMSATRAAPVAIVFAKSAIATLPPANRSPMIPDPTTEASNRAVPTASATTRRPTSFLRARLRGAHKCAHELALHQGRDPIHVYAFSR